MRLIAIFALLIEAFFTNAAEAVALPNTQPLTMEGDIASQMVDGIDRFLLKEIEKSVERRAAYWKRDFSSPEAYNKSIEPNRARLAKMLGLRETRVPFDAPELVATTEQAALVGKCEGYEIYAIRWPVLYDPQPERKITSIHGTGLLLMPTGREPVADVIAIPHCDQTPEQLVGLAEGIPAEAQYARLLAEAGCRVVVPLLINRENYLDGLTNREFLYRSAFELGHHLIGYELQKVLAIVDWFAASKRKIGVIGYGDGGMLALYAGALDMRINAVEISGYFGSREHIWEEPIDRNVFGLLNEFGDAEIAAMIQPRPVLIQNTKIPERQWNGKLGAPARVPSTEGQDAGSEYRRMANGSKPEFSNASFGVSSEFESQMFVDSLLSGRVIARELRAHHENNPQELRKSFDAAARHAEQLNEIDRHNQALLEQALLVREVYTKPLVDAAAKGPAEYEKASAEFRKKFYDEVIGRFDYPLKAANPRSRKVAESEKWTRYEVVLDVFDDVFAYGLLVLPKDIKEGEKRAVVVCQHGLEGRPQSTVEGDNKSYHDFATRLAERGYITFAPQNPYIFKDRFRSLQRKANPLGKTLFSIVVPQHQQIVNWLKTLPQVDGSRIGFYGLSYGGKTAMRVPAIVTDYALSICSADFNEWVWKNASTTGLGRKFTYALKNEYEIFEWDLGSTFNYAEMAMLIAPRPFMVERGHLDGVAPDEAVAWEFARVQRFYDVNLKMPGRARIEFFNGPHTINGVGTFQFLDEFLKK
ncbi:MAG TPA: dienelactone hydrolase family protein [Planctomycetota bacterium]|nr:dienelactone hydrolase family protein [Planctomycetota bacterium]